MPLLLQRHAKARAKRIALDLRSSSDDIQSKLPRNADEIAALLGVSAPSFWWSGTDNTKGVIASTATGTREHWPFGLKNTYEAKNGIACHALSNPGSLESSLSFASGVSFAVAIVARIVGLTSAIGGNVKTVAGGLPYIQFLPYWIMQRWICYAVTASEQNAYAVGESFSPSGSTSVLIGGWDARTRKCWTVAAGSKVESPDTVTSAWATAGVLGIAKWAGGGVTLGILAAWSGADAEIIATSAVSNASKIAGTLAPVKSLTASSSVVLCKTADTSSEVIGANTIAADADGLIIHPSITNRTAKSYELASGTLVGVTGADWEEVGATGLNTLTKLTETAVTSLHQASGWDFTAAATGRHWIECEIKFVTGGTQAVALNCAGGDDDFTCSFNATGLETSYAPLGDCEITEIATGHYSVKWPVDLASTGAHKVYVRGLAWDGEAWVDSYLGSASKSFYVGNLSVIAATLPSVCPISLGSSSTAIAPVVTWTDAAALKRLASGRLTLDLTVVPKEMPATDIVLASWRQSATKYLDLLLAFEWESDRRRLYSLKARYVDGATDETSDLGAGVGWALGTDTGLSRVGSVRVHVSVDSSGLATWWARDDASPFAALPSYEVPEPSTGQAQISAGAGTYSAPVPTGVRLGCGGDGTGQVNMRIAEVAVW